MLSPPYSHLLYTLLCRVSIFFLPILTRPFHSNDPKTVRILAKGREHARTSSRHIVFLSRKHDGFTCVDGLTGFPQAIEAVYPHAEIQQCIYPSDPQFHEICIIQRSGKTHGRPEKSVCSSGRTSHSSKSGNLFQVYADIL